MSCPSTDLSSEIDVTAVDVDAYDKQELIVWASKLELESIDFKSSSRELIDRLTTMSTNLAKSLNDTKRYIFDLKISTSNRDAHVENMINMQINDELETIYSKLSNANEKIKSLQDTIYEVEINTTNEIHEKLQIHVKQQKKKNEYLEKRIEELSNVIESLVSNQRKENGNRVNKSNDEREESRNQNQFMLLPTQSRLSTTSHLSQSSSQTSFLPTGHLPTPTQDSSNNSIEVDTGTKVQRSKSTPVKKRKKTPRRKRLTRTKSKKHSVPELSQDQIYVERSITRRLI